MSRSLFSVDKLDVVNDVTSWHFGCSASFLAVRQVRRNEEPPSFSRTHVLESDFPSVDHFSESELESIRFVVNRDLVVLKTVCPSCMKNVSADCLHSPEMNKQLISIFRLSFAFFFSQNICLNYFRVLLLSAKPAAEKRSSRA